MSEIIIGIKTPFGETSIIKLSDEELDAMGEEFTRLCHDSGQPMTFDRFVRWKALEDAHFLIELRKRESMWHLERFREQRRRHGAA
jgi:hypothetical protein